MKKILVVLITFICMASLLTGCGGEKVKKEEKSTEFKASDYVTLGKYDNIKVTVNYQDVTEEQIKQYVNETLSYYPEYKKSEKTTVESGDFVDIDFEGFKDDVAFENGSAENYILEIGSNSFIPGFEEALIGAQLSEERSIDLTFPENYQSEELAGQAVVFKVKINKILEKKDISFETLTDKYVKKNFDKDTVDLFLEDIKKELEQSNEYNKETDTKKAIEDKLKEDSKVKEVPKSYIDNKVKESIEQFTYICKEQYQMEVKDFLEEKYQMTEKDFKTETENFIKTNLDLKLILLSIADKEGIEVDKKGYDEFVKTKKANFGIENDEDFYKQFTKNSVEEEYRESKALDLVTKKAKVTYEKVKIEDTNKTEESAVEQGENTNSDAEIDDVEEEQKENPEENKEETQEENKEEAE